jgi:hypothetical protein
MKHISARAGHCPGQTTSQPGRCCGPETKVPSSPAGDPHRRLPFVTLANGALHWLGFRPTGQRNRTARPTRATRLHRCHHSSCVSGAACRWGAPRIVSTLPRVAPCPPTHIPPDSRLRQASVVESQRWKDCPDLSHNSPSIGVDTQARSARLASSQPGSSGVRSPRTGKSSGLARQRDARPDAASERT